jgi:SAM domain (Sterile alpha motif)/Adenylate and Guanylate cyclase catalytic domain
MNVAQWLNAIDLGQYEAVFREHEIDAGVLRDLVEADLEKIGVPLGHRKRLLKAIAALGTGETAAKPPSPAPVPSPAAAERRPITVMFCDLVGSTSMAAKLDPEDWRTLVNTYLDEASAAVTGLGGHVLKKLGDGLMALFGYPHAQENDAERAVRAALAIQRALVEINARNARKGAPELSARIGLDSGRWWSMQPARCSAMRPISPRGSRAPPSPARSSSRPLCSGRPPGCSWPRTAGNMNSRGCPRR